MFNWLATVTCFLLTTFACFSEELHQDIKPWQLESLQYFGNGSAKILSNEPWGALKDFQLALSLIDKNDSSASIISFLIFYGQIVAYDSLGFQEHCNQTLGSLVLAMNDYQENEECEDAINENSFSFQENEQSVEFLQSLAQFTPSLQVRNFLLSLVSEIEENACPNCHLSGFLAPDKDWDFDYGSYAIYMLPCKSWWSKCKKWAKEVLTFLGIVHQGYRRFNDIREEHARGKRIRC